MRHGGAARRRRGRFLLALSLQALAPARADEFTKADIDRWRSEFQKVVAEGRSLISLFDIVHGSWSYNNMGEGVVFRDSVGATITDNDLFGNCAGIFLADTGAVIVLLALWRFLFIVRGRPDADRGGRGIVLAPGACNPDREYPP